MIEFSTTLYAMWCENENFMKKIERCIFFLVDQRSHKLMRKYQN
eukprot:12402.XXX_353473_353604_1 [CDS] Oithona nana genome sequencing.